MRHIILCILCVVFASAMDTSQRVISRSCYECVSGVQHDIPRLYWFLYGGFYCVAREAPELTPSHVYAQIAMQNSVYKIGLWYKTPAQYVNVLLLPRFVQMDRALNAKIQECGSRREVWRWFADEYFQQHVLVPAAKGYNRSLVTADISTKPRGHNIRMY